MAIHGKYGHIFNSLYIYIFPIGPKRDCPIRTMAPGGGGTTMPMTTTAKPKGSTGAGSTCAGLRISLNRQSLFGPIGIYIGN